MGQIGAGGFIGEHVANFGLGKKTGLLLPSRFPEVNSWGSILVLENQ
jgi:hypothetical protein